MKTEIVVGVATIQWAGWHRRSSLEKHPWLWKQDHYVAVTGLRFARQLGAAHCCCCCCCVTVLLLRNSLVAGLGVVVVSFREALLLRFSAAASHLLLWGLNCYGNSEPSMHLGHGLERKIRVMIMTEKSLGAEDDMALSLPVYIHYHTGKRIRFRSGSQFDRGRDTGTVHLRIHLRTPRYCILL